MRAVWQKVPLNWQRSPQVTDLADALRKRDPRILLIDLWEWAKTFGDTMSGPRAIARIERGIGWTGKRGVFVAACVETGWIEQDGDTYRIRDWTEVLSVDWSTASVGNEDREDIDESPEERRKRLDRERKRRARRADKGAEPEGTSAEMSASRPHDVRNVSASCPRHVRTMSASCPACVRIVSASEADKKWTNARADQDLDQDLNSKNTPPPPAGGQGTLPVAVQSSPPAQPKRARAKRKATDDATEASITRILTHWRERAEMPRAVIEGKGSEARRRRIRQRLEDGLTEEELCQVADGHLRSPWHMGTDPGCTRPGGYRDVSTLYRDREQCEFFIRLAKSPAANGVPQRTQAPLIRLPPHRRHIRSDIPVGEVEF